MREEKLDRWGDVSSYDQGAARYSGTMQEIQEKFQQASLRRLDERLARKNM